PQPIGHAPTMGEVPERQAQVGVLSLQPVEPASLLTCAQTLLGVARHGDVEVGVRRLYPLLFAGREQRVLPVFADRLQQREPPPARSPGAGRRAGGRSPRCCVGRTRTARSRAGPPARAARTGPPPALPPALPAALPARCRPRPACLARQARPAAARGTLARRR